MPTFNTLVFAETAALLGTELPIPTLPDESCQTPPVPLLCHQPVYLMSDIVYTF